jgi:hypothetical protein
MSWSNKKEWHKWFAWYPVRIYYNIKPEYWSWKWAWLKYVEHNPVYLGQGDWGGKYREIGSNWE